MIGEEFERLPVQKNPVAVTVHDRSPPAIIAAAILSHTAQVIALKKPARHSDVIEYMVYTLNEAPPIGGEQGFLTVDGRFVDRVVAKHCAVMNRQLLPRASGLPELFSEDVW